MTQLDTLIAEYRCYRDDKFLTHSKRDAAAVALANYVLAHQAEWTERETLERAVVEAWEKVTWKHDEASDKAQEIQDELANWLMSHKEST
jgi:hypothetical protein